MATKIYSTTYSIDQVHYWLERVELSAKLQEIAENQFNDLASIARDGIVMVNSLKEGDIVTKEWCQLRDMLVARAQQVITDTPER